MSAPGPSNAGVETMSAEDAAAYWMVKRDQGTALAEDAGFRTWLAASNDNAKAWARAQQVWNDFDKADDPFLDAMRQDALQARGPRPALTWIAAGIVVAFLGAGAATWKLGLFPATRGAAIEANAKPDFATARGAQATYALADGSKVTLDSGSAVALRYSPDRRAVRLLYGQAYFEVVHDPARPFVVQAGDHTVTDLGTEFDVRLNAASVSILLAKGSVSVRAPAAGAAAVLLRPGQRLDAAPGSGAKVSPVDLEQALAWRTGYLEFHDESLSAALAEMARYDAAPAVIKDPGIGALKVSGRFRTGDTTRFVATLAEVYPLRTQPRPDGGVDILPR